MNTLRKILAYVDPRPESAAALEQAVRLAKRTGASVTAADVVEDSTLWPGDPLLRSVPADTRRNLLEDLAGRIRREGTAIDVVVCAGRTSVELIRLAIGGDHDLVIKTAKGRGADRSSLFGSTALRLIRKCPSPVWLVGPSSLPAPRKILAAVDPGAEGDLVSAGLARRIVTHAASLADRIDAELHVLHVWHLPGEHLLERHGPLQEVRALAAGQEKEARRQLRATLAHADVSLRPERVHLFKGRPESLIPSFARDEQVDVIVMGSVGRSGIAGLLIGEMAEEILARVDCSVLCVKPEGFISPIRPRS